MCRKRGALEAPTERKEVILAMADVGVRQCDVADYYGMPASTVRSIVHVGRKNNGEEK